MTYFRRRKFDPASLRQTGFDGHFAMIRLIAGTKTVITMLGGRFPAQPIAEAREWARGLTN